MREAMRSASLPYLGERCAAMLAGGCPRIRSIGCGSGDAGRHPATAPQGGSAGSATAEGGAAGAPQGGSAAASAAEGGAAPGSQGGSAASAAKGGGGGQSGGSAVPDGAAGTAGARSATSEPLPLPGNTPSLAVEGPVSAGPYTVQFSGFSFSTPVCSGDLCLRGGFGP